MVYHNTSVNESYSTFIVHLSLLLIILIQKCKPMGHKLYQYICVTYQRNVEYNRPYNILLTSVMVHIGYMAVAKVRLVRF